MKRFLILLTLFFSFAIGLSAKEKLLIRWDCTKSELFETFSKDGWKVTYSENILSATPPLDFDPVIEGYENLSFLKLIFLFQNDLLCAQTLVFDEAKQKYVFATILKLACADNAKFIGMKQKKMDDNAYQFVYDVELPDMKATYTATGNENRMQLGISYFAPWVK